MASDILLIVAGLVGVSCFFGGAFYLISVANEIKVVKKSTLTVVGAAGHVDSLQD